MYLDIAGSQNQSLMSNRTGSLKKNNRLKHLCYFILNCTLSSFKTTSPPAHANTHTHSIPKWQTSSSPSVLSEAAVLSELPPVQSTPDDTGGKRRRNHPQKHSCQTHMVTPEVPSPPPRTPTLCHTLTDTWTRTLSEIFKSELFEMVTIFCLFNSFLWIKASRSGSVCVYLLNVSKQRLKKT